MLTSLPPALWLLIAAPIVAKLSNPIRSVIGVVLPLLVLAQVWTIIAADTTTTVQFLGYNIHPVAVHSTTGVFATIFCLMTSAGALFLANKDRPLELAGALVYAGGALGVTFSGDWISLFMFWEIMTLGSTTIIFSTRSQYSYGAGLRYFALHAVGGVVLFAGIVWLLHINGGQVALVDVLVKEGAEGTARIMGPLSGYINDGGAGSGAAWLILIGMLINAGAPPLSAWVADAYPAARETGTVFLSAFTTKTAIFTLITAFSGTEVIIYVGMFMAVYGIIYAILENDIRRILAYLIVNQVGFMICAIGVGTVTSINGACAHAFSHIVYKGLILMSVGAVIQATGKTKLSEVGGLFRTMPVTMCCGVVAALAMSGFPLTSGYTTKSLITTGTVLYAGTTPDNSLILNCWYVLEAASACVFLFGGMRVVWCVFFGKDSGLRPPDAPLNQKLAMIAFAVLSLLVGLMPTPLYEILPNPAAAIELGKHQYGFMHVLKLLGLLIFFGVSFVLLLPLLKRNETITLDADWLYRRAIPWLWRNVCLPPLRGLGKLQTAVMDGLPRFVSSMVAGQNGMGSLRVFREWTVGAVVVLIILMLMLFMLVHYVAGS